MGNGAAEMTLSPCAKRLGQVGQSFSFSICNNFDLGISSQVHVLSTLEDKGDMGEVRHDS